MKWSFQIQDMFQTIAYMLQTFK